MHLRLRAQLFHVSHCMIIAEMATDSVSRETEVQVGADPRFT